MWFIWIMWVIVALAIIATIILLTGKGSMLVSGFNTMDLCQYFGHKKLKGYADFFNSSSSFCCGVI